MLTSHELQSAMRCDAPLLALVAMIASWVSHATLHLSRRRRRLRTRWTRCSFVALPSRLPDAARQDRHHREPLTGERARGRSGSCSRGCARVGLPFRTRPYIGRRRPGRPLDFSIGTTTHYRPAHQRAVCARPLCARAARFARALCPRSPACHVLRPECCGCLTRLVRATYMTVFRCQERRMASTSCGVLDGENTTECDDRCAPHRVVSCRSWCRCDTTCRVCVGSVRCGARVACESFSPEVSRRERCMGFAHRS